MLESKNSRGPDPWGMGGRMAETTVLIGKVRQKRKTFKAPNLMNAYLPLSRLLVKQYFDLFAL